MEVNQIRVDHKIIAELIDSRSRVLDLGCGDGSLLKYLVTEKSVVGRGVEITEEGMEICVSKGLSVLHGDIDEGLQDYKDGFFDYVVLSQTLQVVHRPKFVIKEMLRVGKKAVVSFPNFGNWRVRLDLLFSGRMPKSDVLPFEWYDTPNIHLCTVKDFRILCSEMGIRIEREIYLKNQDTENTGLLVRVAPNLFAGIAIYLISNQP
ncbi:MAG: methionine biosynthesis protein MetW [Actinobacteria bacterium]|nr:methionine biosynthesis protein MetW [Actinomycetota bacterium]